MKRPIAVMATLLVAVTTNAMAGNLEVLTPVSLSHAQQKVVRTGVAQELKDPEAARFTKIIAGRGAKGSITVCGLVNGKNSYGAYTGAKPFIGVLLSDRFLISGSVDSNPSTTFAMCEDSGLSL